ncbi:hypothetical protein HK100_000369 [Physocladia obscura]|uniref:Uncharacterized protein n=1 Tax=Physocladia obscura TaxID=109957 RepID=A0AAD5T4I1_9FUNG|nr:hypothetical protein HK100_000369 [Physocladia obscura]
MEDQGRGYGAYVKNRAELEFAAKLFLVSSDALESAITTASSLEDDIICTAFLDVSKSVAARSSLTSVCIILFSNGSLNLELESRLDSTTGEADENEGIKIHLVLNSKEVQRTPGFIKKSIGSLNGLANNFQDRTKTVDHPYQEKRDPDDKDDRNEAAAEAAATKNAKKLTFKPVERMS